MALTFDGKNIESLFHCGDPSFTILNSMPDTVDVPGRDGLAARGFRFGPSTVAFSLSPKASAPSERREAWSTLGRWLDVDAPKRLVMPDTGWYWMALPSGAVDVERLVRADKASLSFSIIEPAAYGATRTATVPSGGSVSIDVGGTYPTRPMVTASATRDASSQVWGVRLDGGPFVHVPTGSDSARNVAVDCAKGTCKVAGASRMLTLDSDWLELAPGAHTIANDEGSGSALVTWIERWL